MRLICPNCDAQYDIPDDAMLPGGRDVQCSNCEHTWYQDFPEGDTDTAPVRPELAPQSKSSSEVGENVVDASRPESAPQAPPAPSRKPLDPTVASVLQEEAQLESQARKKEQAGPVETQPDLGLRDTLEESETRKRADKARARVIRPTQENTAAVAEETAVVAAGSRRALLPDIQEINSTMRSNNDRSPTDDPGQTAQIEARERRGFTNGFILVIALTVVLTLLYVLSPQITEALPQAEAWITTYVAKADQGRAALNDMIEAFLTWLDTVVAPSNP